MPAGTPLNVPDTLIIVRMYVSAMRRLMLSATVTLVLLAACSPSASPPTLAPTVPPTAVPLAATAASTGEIVVFAASSLTDVFQDMANTYQQANPGAKLT